MRKNSFRNLLFIFFNLIKNILRNLVLQLVLFQRINCWQAFTLFCFKCLKFHLSKRKMLNDFYHLSFIQFYFFSLIYFNFHNPPEPLFLNLTHWLSASFFSNQINLFVKIPHFLDHFGFDKIFENHPDFLSSRFLINHLFSILFNYLLSNGDTFLDLKKMNYFYI